MEIKAAEWGCGGILLAVVNALQGIWNSQFYISSLQQERLFDHCLVSGSLDLGKHQALVPEGWQSNLNCLHLSGRRSMGFTATPSSHLDKNCCCCCKESASCVMLSLRFWVGENSPGSGLARLIPHASGFSSSGSRTTEVSGESSSAF